VKGWVGRRPGDCVAQRRQRLPEKSRRWEEARRTAGRSINGIVVRKMVVTRMGAVCGLQPGVGAGDARANSWHCARQPFARRDPTSVLR
jgi:hypothetical protein